MLKQYLAKLDPQERRKAIVRFRTIKPRNDQWLHDWVSIYFGLDIPRGVHHECVHKGHVAPFKAFSEAYFAREPITVWKAARGSGKTLMLAILAGIEAVTLAARVNLLGGSGEQSQNVNAYLNGTDPNVMGMFFDAPVAPRGMIKGAFRREVKFTNGGLIRALMASPTSVRGPHPQRLRLDEVDEMEIGIFDSAMGQTMSHHGVVAQTVCSSTHQHADGTFTEILDRAEKGGWPVNTWCYRENFEENGGWLDKAEMEWKRRQVPAHMWDTEYELNEPSAEGRVFTDEVIEALFDKMLGVYEGEPGEDIVVLDPHEADTFYHGADWGRKKDWSVIHTMAERNSGPDELAAWGRYNRTSGQQKWSQLVAKFNDRVEAYGGESMYDATGVGDAVEEHLTVYSDPFLFSNTRERTQMLTNYVSACEDGSIVCPDIKFAKNEHKYLTRDMLYGSKHLPDSVAAGALAWKVRKQKSNGLLIARA